MPLPPEDWTEPERWVWEQVRTSQAADFNARYGKYLDPKNDYLWAEDEIERRSLRRSFLMTIILCAPWANHLRSIGVRIRGAYFNERISLFNSEINCDLWLVESVFTDDVDFCRVSLKYDLNLQGSNVFGKFIIDGGSANNSIIIREGRFNHCSIKGVNIGGQLVMDKAKFEGSMHLTGSSVKGGVGLNGSIIEENLLMDGASIGTGLFVRNAIIRSAIMRGMNIDGDVAMEEVRFFQELAMDRTKVKGALFLDNGIFEAVSLVGIRVGDQLALKGTTFRSFLKLDSALIGSCCFLDGGSFVDISFLGIKVGMQLFMTNVTVSGELALDGASIGSSLSMEHGDFNSLSLLEVSVGGQIVMSSATVRGAVEMERLYVHSDMYLTMSIFLKNVNISFAKIEGDIVCEGARFESLDLSDTKTNALYDGKYSDRDGDIWPTNFNLLRFHYNYIRGSLSTENSNDFPDRSVSWFKKWLERHKPFSLQPYEQSAKVLRDSGHSGKANAVLYMGKERERWEPDGRYGRWLFLTCSKVLLGHCLGKRFFLFPFLWALGFLGLGMLIYSTTPNAGNSPLWWLGYSLDQLIPLVQFGKEFSDIKLGDSWQNYYFMFQKIFGWFLALLIAAGLAGVGKPGGRE